MDFDDIMNDGNLNVDQDIFESELLSHDQVLPEKLYIIPIRFRPIFPGIVTPLIISAGKVLPRRWRRSSTSRCPWAWSS